MYLYRNRTSGKAENIKEHKLDIPEDSLEPFGHWAKIYLNILISESKPDGNYSSQCNQPTPAGKNYNVSWIRDALIKLAKKH